jgi:ribulose bisphosphate carboxylase small subunit
MRHRTLAGRSAYRLPEARTISSDTDTYVSIRTFAPAKHCRICSFVPVKPEARTISSDTDTYVSIRTFAPAKHCRICSFVPVKQGN